MCSFQGYWLLSLGGTSFYFSFTTGGNWGAGTDWRTVDASPTIGGTYTYAAGRVSLREGRGTPTGCDTAATGVYSVVLDSTCNRMDWTLVSEGCDSRGMTLNGAAFTR